MAAAGNLGPALPVMPLMSLSTPLIMHHPGGGEAAGFSLSGHQGNHNHSHTHAIQLQTSLEMGPVVCPALCEIRTQLQELTRSVESCQNEVSRRPALVALLFVSPQSAPTRLVPASAPQRR